MIFSIAMHPDDRDRYSRQTRLPEWGQDGQDALRQTRILLCGLGGIGAAAAPYLAGAGVGTLGLADIDRIELSNLHRQPLYAMQDIGRHKVDATVERLRAAASHVNYIPYYADQSPETLLAELPSYDIIIDGTDRFTVRAALHEAAFAARRPLIHAAAEGYAGYLTVFKGYLPDKPCLHCFMPDIPDETAAAGCAGQGVLGPVPGIIGTAAAAEALKIALSIGVCLTGMLWKVNALTFETRRAGLVKDAGCECCSKQHENL